MGCDAGVMLLVCHASAMWQCSTKGVRPCVIKWKITRAPIDSPQNASPLQRPQPWASWVLPGARVSALVIRASVLITPGVRITIKFLNHVNKGFGRMQGKRFCATLKLFCLRTLDQEWNQWLQSDLLPHLATAYSDVQHNLQQVWPQKCFANYRTVLLQ